MRFSLIFILLNCYALSSCDTKRPAKNTPSVIGRPTLEKVWAKSFIDSINNRFSKQIATGDSVALATHYWPDAELLLDNSEVIKGGDILNTWGSLIRMGVKEMIFSTSDLTGSADFIIETGKYNMKDAKKNLMDRGKYVVIWERRNGEWKLYRDIGCTSMPAKM